MRHALGKPAMTATVLWLGLAGSARATAPVTVTADRLFERGGRVVVPVACHRTSCERSSVAIGGERRRLQLIGSGRTSFSLAGPRRARRIAVTLRHRRWRRRVVLPLLHRPDPFRCGYGDTARVVAAVTGTRILRIEDDREDATTRVIACLAGRPWSLADEYSSLGSSDGGRGAGAPMITARWVAVAVTSYSRGDVYPSISMRRRPDGHGRQIHLDPTRGNDVLAYGVTDDGAVAATQQDPCSRLVTVRIVDARGEQLVDTLPGVDPLSLHVEGTVVSWLRDGRRQQVVTDGAPPRRLPEYPPYAICP